MFCRGEKQRFRLFVINVHIFNAQSIILSWLMIDIDYIKYRHRKILNTFGDNIKRKLCLVVYAKQSLKMYYLF